MSKPSAPETADWSPLSAKTADYARRSNLAMAFLCLPRQKRADMNVFYTFCRLVDDIADSETLPISEKAALLDAWRAALDQRPTDEERLAALRAAIQVGVDDLENGQFVEFATIGELDAHLDGLLSEAVPGKRSE